MTSEDKIITSITFTIFAGLLYVLIGAIIASPDRIVKENDTHIWVMEHSLYNRDSTIYVYHKPIIYEGVVIEKTGHFVGVAGKGGHRIDERVIKYNNTTYKTSDFPWNTEVGRKVKVVEKFYPHHDIQLIW